MTPTTPPSSSASSASQSSTSTISSIRCGQIRRLGPLQNLLGMIPGLGKELRGVKVDEREFDRIQAIITSMTRKNAAIQS